MEESSEISRMNETWERADGISTFRRMLLIYIRSRLEAQVAFIAARPVDIKSDSSVRFICGSTTKEQS